MIFQGDIARMTGLDLTRVSRAATALGLSPVVAARGPRPGKYTVGDAAKVLSYVRLRAAGVGDAEARAAAELVDEDTWRELAWRDRPLWLVCAAGADPVLGDAKRIVDYIGAAPSARTVNLLSCLRDVLDVAVERAETPA